MWNSVTSAMSATILHIIQLFIVPISPTVWQRCGIASDPISAMILMKMECRVDREIHIGWVEERLTRDARCGSCPETLLHRLWKCEINAACTHPGFLDTQNLMQEATEGSVNNGAFWLGCILTADTLAPKTDSVFGIGRLPGALHGAAAVGGVWGSN